MYELGLLLLVDLLISQTHYLLAIFEIQAQWIHCLLAIFEIQALWIHNLLAIFLKYIISHELIFFRIDFILFFTPKEVISKLCIHWGNALKS